MRSDETAIMAPARLDMAAAACPACTSISAERVYIPTSWIFGREAMIWNPPPCIFGRERLSFQVTTMI